MIKYLIKAAAELDNAGFRVEADLLDQIMKKVAIEVAENDANDFGFLSSKEKKAPVAKTEAEPVEETEVESEVDDEEDESEETEPEEEVNEDDEELSLKECIEHCRSFSNEDKAKLIKALIDDLC